MKTMKIVLALLLSALLITMSFITAVASVVPATTETKSGEVVTIEFSYDNIAGIRGTFTITGDEIIKDIVFKPSSNFSGSYNEEEGIIAYYAPSAAKFVGTLEVTITDTAVAGDECKITLEYETTADGKLPTDPDYKYDYATIKIGVDYTELNKQIAIAEKLDKSDYTDASWKALEDALKAAVEAKNSNSQATVDAAAEALKKAIKALVPKSEDKPPINNKELSELIDIANGLNKDGYTAESWKKVEAALAKAIKALNSGSQAAIDAAFEELNAAIEGLEVKKTDTVIESPATQDVSNDILYLLVIAVFGLSFVCISKKKIESK